MCADLWKNPAARAILTRISPLLGDDVEALTTTAGASTLLPTLNAQRAIHAHHLGHWFAFRAAHPEFALDGALGHSVGVVAALVAADSMTAEDSAVFVRERARAFSDVCAALAEPAGLAAIAADDLDDALEEIAGFGGVTLALRNTVGKGSIGGAHTRLEAFAAKAREEDWPVRLRILDVEGPFHTEVFRPCVERLARALAGFTIRTPRVPVFMGTSGRAERDPGRIRDLLALQPVTLENHLGAVRAAHAHGCRLFVEVAHAPQPVHWLKDQLVDGSGAPLHGVTGHALTTADLL